MFASRGRVLFSRLQTICRGGNNPSFLSFCNHPLRVSLLENRLNRRCLGTASDISENKGETLKKPVLEKRSSEQEERVKYYLSLIDHSTFRKQDYVRETKSLLADKVFLFPNELSSSICYMYRLGLTKLALEVFHVYRKNNMLSLVNQMSLKYIMLCAAEAKDLRSLHMVYNSQSPSRQNSVILNSTYIRCLLSLNEVKQATSLLSQFLNNPVYKRTNVSGGNDLYSNAIVGFYEGHFYTRCIATFHSIRPIAPTLSIASKHQIAAGKTEENGLVPLDEDKWRLVQNSLCYSAVIGSYYQLGEFQLALQYYDEARKLGVFPRFREGMMIADIHANSQEFRDQFAELKSKKVDVSGVPKNELERYWLNESKVPQMRRALRQVFWNWYYNRSYCPKFEPKANAICTYVGDDRIVGNVLLMLGTMYDLKYFAEKDLTNTKMLIKTGLNEKAMKELTQFLEEEMYPILPYRVENRNVEIQVKDAQAWVKNRRLLNLSLRLSVCLILVE